MEKEETKDFLKAIRLRNDENGDSYFEIGKIPTHFKFENTTFWASKNVENWEKNKHVAPRKQFVVTLKGKLIFKVSDGSTFVLEPGIILLAEDVSGKGHSWILVDGYEHWERLYITPTGNSEDYFIKE